MFTISFIFPFSLYSVLCETGGVQNMCVGVVTFEFPTLDIDRVCFENNKITLKVTSDSTVIQIKKYEMKIYL